MFQLRVVTEVNELQHFTQHTGRMNVSEAWLEKFVLKGVIIYHDAQWIELCVTQN